MFVSFSPEGMLGAARCRPDGPPQKPHAARRRNAMFRLEGLETRITPSDATAISIQPATLTATYGDNTGKLGVGVTDTTTPDTTPTGSVDFYNGDPNAGGSWSRRSPPGSQGDAAFGTSSLSVTPAGTPDQIFAVYQPSDPTISTPARRRLPRR